MMQIATWLSVIALGPGAIAVFVWFLFDLRRILRRDDAPPSVG
ncbi:MAG TPA: hypothetical protein PKC18_10885 [Lacipirellulaceae bacterium]|nr:hypothetical protein [Lacipirellulaceae bacterium]HMP07285.1 hypothetical protein [Lacipirellulaceae bacterium]